MTALIGFVRELSKELRFRADMIDDITSSPASPGEILRMIADSIEAAAKRTLLA